MFGSDWPVCLVAASYEQVLEIVYGVFKKYSTDEQAQFFGGNATTFYNLT
jgi:L-fuconolactonase